MLAIRFKNARKQAGLTQQELGDKAGVSQQTIHQIEKGVIEHPRRLNRLSKILGVSAAYLLYGEESPSSVSGQEPQVNKLPLLTPYQAGNLPGSLSGVKEKVTYFGFSGANWFGMKMWDDSMVGPGEVSIPEGATLIIEPCSELNSGSIGVFKLSDGDVVCRKYRKNGPDIVLQALNNDYKSIGDAGAQPIGEVRYALLFKIISE